MKSSTLISVLMLLAISTQAQYAMKWQRSFGGSAFDYSNELIPTNDGGYLSVGFTSSVDGDIQTVHGSGDCLIVKLDSLGSVKWQQELGGSDKEEGNAALALSDGGFVVAGYAESNDGDLTSNHGNGDSWVVRLDANGSIQWQQAIGGTGHDHAEGIVSTADGGFLVTGYTESNNGDFSGNHGNGDAFVVKLDSLGNVEWQKLMGGSSYDIGKSLIPSSDGNFLMIGETGSNDGNVTVQHGNGDIWLVKFNNAGSIIWEHSYGGSLNENGQSLVETPDGGFLLSGYTESTNGDILLNHGNGDVCVLKVNELGVLQWEKSLGSSGNDYAYSIKENKSGNYLVAGYSEMNDGDVSGNHGNYDCWLVSIDQNGNLLNQHSFGGSGVDIAYAILPISDTQLLFAGYTESSDQDVAVNHGNGDCWIVQLDALTLSVQGEKLNRTVKVYPIPATTDLWFSGLTDGDRIELIDLQGKLVLTKQVNTMETNVEISDLAAGTYFYRIYSPDQDHNQTGKMVKN